MDGNGHEIQERLLSAWFGGSTHDPGAASARLSLWFTPDPAFDASLRGAFLADLDAAARGEHGSWQGTPRGALALVILLDQIPRNVYRATARAFDHDPHAQRICLEALSTSADSALHPVERGFLLMPLQHAEDDELQARSISEYERLVAGTPDPWREVVEPFLDSARQHDALIARFGRFPHRNVLLGRAPTPDEEAFLAAWATRFGE